MTSQINPNNIDGNYPVAGVSNNTQGMRDNFTNTKTNFQYAADEITELQTNGIFKAALTDTTLDNNMNDNLLYAVKLNDVSYVEKQLTTTAGTATLDYSAAMYQAIPSVTGNLSLAFTNWPVSGTVGTLNFAIVVTNTAYTLTLPATVSVGLARIDGISPGTAGVTNTITFAANGTYVYKFETADGGSTISIENTIRPTNTYSGIINITNTTPSTNTTTGALVVAGGVGIGGNLHIGGTLCTYDTNGNVSFNVSDTTGFVQVYASNVPANTSGALNIIGSSDGSYQPVYNTGSMLHITSNSDAAARITNDSFGASALSYPALIQRRARGTAASPSAVQNGDLIGKITGAGWGTSNYVLYTGNISPTSIDMVATENYATANAGSKIDFYTSNIGAVTRTLSATMTGNVTTFPRILSATGNIIGGNISTAGILSSTGNITTPGNILLTDGGTMGYNSGSGGTVSQSGNKSGGVTLNKPSGEITMQSTNLAADTTVSFTLTNSTIGAHDLLLLNIVGGVATGAAYNLDANCTSGSAVISVRNITGGTLGEAIVIRYVVIRGSIA